jgi:hypothetical protein
MRSCAESPESSENRCVEEDWSRPQENFHENGRNPDKPDTNRALGEDSYIEDTERESKSNWPIPNLMT